MIVIVRACVCTYAYSNVFQAKGHCNAHRVRLATCQRVVYAWNAWVLSTTTLRLSCANPATVPAIRAAVPARSVAPPAPIRCTQTSSTTSACRAARTRPSRTVASATRTLVGLCLIAYVTINHMSICLLPWVFTK